MESHAHPTHVHTTHAHTIHLEAQAPSAERDRLVRRARWLAAGGLAWHGIEAAVAIGAGIVAGSIALIGFGADSVVEMIAGVVVLWRFAEARDGSASVERRAQQLIAGSFVLIAVYVGFEAVRSLAIADEPGVSWVGIALSVVSLATMPLLARAKTGVSRRIHSSAGVAEARQTVLCTYMAAALLAGLGANALFGWWWADPIAGLAIAAIAADEARKAWRGEQCCAH
jgi:divalent metal cation (Fe/Co/Zn/Cd) transporter